MGEDGNGAELKALLARVPYRMVELGEVPEKTLNPKQGRRYRLGLFNRYF